MCPMGASRPAPERVRMRLPSLKGWSFQWGIIGGLMASSVYYPSKTQGVAYPYGQAPGSPPRRSRHSNRRRRCAQGRDRFRRMPSDGFRSGSEAGHGRHSLVRPRPDEKLQPKCALGKCSAGALSRSSPPHANDGRSFAGVADEPTGNRCCWRKRCDAGPRIRRRNRLRRITHPNMYGSERE